MQLYDETKSTHDDETECIQNKKTVEKLQTLQETLTSCYQSTKSTNPKLIADTLHNIGLIYMENMGQYENALRVFKEAVEIRKEYFENDHIEIMRSLYRLGITQYALEQYEEAAVSLQNALDRSTSIVGSTNFIIAEILNNLACIYYRMNDLKLSLDTFEKSYLIQKNLLRDELYGDYDERPGGDRNNFLLNIATTGSNMGFLSTILGDLDEAIALLESSLLVSHL